MYVHDPTEVSGLARRGRTLAYLPMAPVHQAGLLPGVPAHHSGSFSHRAASSHPLMISKSGSFTVVTRHHTDRQVSFLPQHVRIFWQWCGSGTSWLRSDLGTTKKYRRIDFKKDFLF